MQIGKIKRVPLREIWPHEAHDFTRWLQENLDTLSDVLDFSLTSAEREKPAGNFNVDLVAQDEEGHPVVIENQFGKSDHDHLGKVITYTTMLGAKKAVWIVGEARAEHIQSIATLNESKDIAYYLVKLEGIRIQDSPSAPLFTLLVKPSEEGRQAGAIKKEIADTEMRRRRFWTELLALAKKKTTLHSTRSPGDNHWLTARVGKLDMNYLIYKHEAGVELYIDRGDEVENKSIYDKLLKSKDVIERAFGAPLEWMRLDQKRACRIRKDIPGGGLDDEPHWSEIQNRMIDTMIQFEKALKPFIEKLGI